MIVEDNISTGLVSEPTGAILSASHAADCNAALPEPRGVPEGSEVMEECAYRLATSLESVTTLALEYGWRDLKKWLTWDVSRTENDLLVLNHRHSDFTAPLVDTLGMPV
jgi:hypothetical protein